MLHKEKHFWTQRYKQHGHTGWKNPIIYAYDQAERLCIVSEQLDSMELQPETALDFGCGTGDFSRLLLKKSLKVWGYDPYVQPEISDSRFNYLSEASDISIPDGELGLILAVTVLDHILDDKLFEYQLKYFRKKISKRGFLLMMEYALDKPRVPSRYQAFRSVDTWKRYLTINGWELSAIKPVPHPVEAPSVGFLRYQRRVLVRVLGKFAKTPVFRLLSAPMLKHLAELTFRKYGHGKVESSPLKVMTSVPNSSDHA